jgi:hypothetical protein
MTYVAALLQQGANNAGLFLPSAVLQGTLHGLEAQYAEHQQRPLRQPEVAYLLQRVEASPAPSSSLAICSAISTVLSPAASKAT